MTATYNPSASEIEAYNASVRGRQAAMPRDIPAKNRLLLPCPECGKEHMSNVSCDLTPKTADDTEAMREEYNALYGSSAYGRPDRGPDPYRRFTGAVTPDAIDAYNAEFRPGGAKTAPAVPSVRRFADTQVDTSDKTAVKEGMQAVLRSYAASEGLDVVRDRAKLLGGLATGNGKHAEAFRELYALSVALRG